MQSEKEEENAKAPVHVVKAEASTNGNGVAEDMETKPDESEAKPDAALKQDGDDKQSMEEEEDEAKKEEGKKEAKEEGKTEATKEEVKKEGKQEEGKKESKQEEGKKEEGKKEVKEQLPEKPILQLHGKQSSSGKSPAVFAEDAHSC